MNSRLKLLIGIAVGMVALAIGEVVLFANLGGPRAVFIQIAGLGLLTALGTVTARNLVHAALYLVAFFFLVACLFVLLEAEFLAAMQVLVYIGAVAILLMFGIMLTRNILGDETTGGHWARRLPAALLSLALLGLLVVGIRDRRAVSPELGGAALAWTEVRSRPPLDDPARADAVNDMARTLGIELMTRWVIPFEVAGLLLTASLVGAIALAMAEPGEEIPATQATTVKDPESSTSAHMDDVPR